MTNLPWTIGQNALHLPLRPNFPFLPTTAAGETPALLTPTNFGATTCRVFPFFVPSSQLPVGKIYMASPGAVANAMQIGIFDQNGTRIYNSGTLSTTANMTVITVSPTLKLPCGHYYFGITNANLVSVSNAYVMSPALPAASVARWGTVAATAGAMPASITVTGITATVGGWPIYTVLAQV